MRIFISGGTGFVGKHLCRELLARGHALKVLVHRRVGTPEHNVVQVEGDVTSPESVLSAMAGCDAAINLVGIIREFPDRGVTFQKLHVQATATVVDMAVKAGISRYLHMSALGVRPEAVSAYHRSKYAAEEHVRKSPLNATIFRPSVIFGLEDAFINQLASLVRLLPAVPVIGNGRYRLQPIHVDDVARCFAMALENPETVGQTYGLCGPDRVSYNDLLDLVGAVLGKKKVRKIHAPLSLMQFFVPLLQNIPSFPLTVDQLTMLLEESICDGLWQQSFPFTPTPLKEGMCSYLC